MAKENGPETPEEQLAAMSDGAVDQAIETLERAKRSLQHADNLIPEPAGNADADIDWVDGKVADADHRAGEAIDQLEHERRGREEDDD